MGGANQGRNMARHSHARLTSKTGNPANTLKGQTWAAWREASLRFLRWSRPTDHLHPLGKSCLQALRATERLPGPPRSVLGCQPCPGAGPALEGWSPTCRLGSASPFFSLLSTGVKTLQNPNYSGPRLQVYLDVFSSSEVLPRFLKRGA